MKADRQQNGGRNLREIAFLVSGLLLMAGFQNCGQVTYVPPAVQSLSSEPGAGPDQPSPAFSDVASTLIASNSGLDLGVAATGELAVQQTGSAAGNQIFHLQDIGGGHVRMISAVSGQCVGIRATSLALSPCLNLQSQLFTFTKGSDGLYTIQNPFSANCLAVSLASVNPGAAVVPMICDLVPSQKFGLNGAIVAAALKPSAYGGTAATVPGTVKSENFDEGGEGVAYHWQAASANTSGYRQTDVALVPAAGGAFSVATARPGDWFNYQISVAKSGKYSLIVPLGSNAGGIGRMHMEVDGLNVTGTLSSPFIAAPVSSQPFALAAGPHTIKIMNESGTLSLGDFTFIAVP